MPKKSSSDIDITSTEARRLAAKILGRIGGMAGRGASKRRPSDMCKAAINKRWAACRAQKAAQLGVGAGSHSSRAMSELADSRLGRVARSEAPVDIQMHVQRVLSKHGFPEFRPSNELMNELKKAPAHRRCGVYIHAFKGGRDFYVGISVDVRKRYMTHLKNFPDIESSTVIQVPADRQFAIEFDLIGDLMRVGVPLRNLLRPDLAYSEEDVKLIVDELSSLDCVSDTASFYRGLQQVKDPVLERSLNAQHPLTKKFEQMKAHALYSKFVSQVFARYIRTCIPLPALAERTFWTVSCMNPGLYPKPSHKIKVLVRVNVTRPEVFSAFIDDLEPDPLLVYNFYVAAGPISSAELARLRAIPGVQYNANYQKSLKLPLHQFFAVTAEAAMLLLDSDEFRNAAKLHNLLLMRKWGQNTVRRVGSHNLPLSKLLFSTKVSL